MKKIPALIPFLILLLIIAGCSENSDSPTSSQTQVFLFERNGLVDSIAGTCSAYIVRTIILDSIDTRDFSTVRFEMNSYTDGDLSNITLYYLKDTAVNIFSLSGTGAINNTTSITTPSPNIKGTLYLRLKLFASVCTGEYYHLKMKNLRIFGIK
ncbi:MAG: hypothetical protein HY959_10945 [Ignavibacteriae bacterium]|nr:hypothetical protein [Ignavibacteriota bacterium]